MKAQTKPGLEEPVGDLKEERKQTEVVKPAKTSPGSSSPNACSSVSEMGWGGSGGKAAGQHKGPWVGSDRSHASTKQIL